MDTTEKRYANFKAFKEDLLQWKNAHQEEYAQFARQMNDGDGFQFVRFFCRKPTIARPYENLADFLRR